VVNVTQRLQSAATPGQIIISEAVYLKVKESFQCRYVSEVTLKNKAQPVKIYEVVE
jgi:class 3 adenylate cyclase